MALTAHFPPSTPLACVGGNNAPKPGVVGIDALVGAYAQTGRLCPMVIGTMPETGLTPPFDERPRMRSSIWLTPSCRSSLSGQALSFGRHRFHANGDRPQPRPRARRFFGLESTRESMKIFADMLRKKGGYDPEELKALRDWVLNVKFKARIFNNTEEIIEKRLPLYTGGKLKPPA